LLLLIFLKNHLKHELLFPVPYIYCDGYINFKSVEKCK
jgi:hypothetical protein